MIASGDGAVCVVVPAEERLALLIDAVQEYAIFLLDDRGCVATWNRGAQRIKGYSADEIIGQHFSRFYTDEDVADGKPARELETAIATGEYRDVGWRVRKDGSRFWANVVVTALFNSSGGLEGFAKITRDETERVLADEVARTLQLLSERDRIAVGLGEGMVHRIFEASLMLQGALKVVEDPEATSRIVSAIDALDQAIKEVRSVVADLTS